MKKSMFKLFLSILFLGTASMNAQSTDATDTINRGESIDIVITASNVDFTQASNVINFIHAESGTNVPVSISNVQIIDPTKIKIRAKFDEFHLGGLYDLEIYNWSFITTITKLNAVFLTGTPIVIQPIEYKLDSISLHEAKIGDDVKFKVYGKNIGKIATNTNEFRLVGTEDNIRADFFTVINDNEVVVSFSFNNFISVGSYDFIAKDSILIDAFSLSYKITNAKITSISADTINQGESLDIILTAENIDFRQGSNLIKVYSRSNGNHLLITDLYVIDSVNVKFKIKVNHTSTLGYYDLNLGYFNTTLNLIEENAFYVKTKPNAPSIKNISKYYGTEDTKDTLFVFGSKTNFSSATGINMQLKSGFISIYSTKTEVVNDTVLKVYFNFPLHTPKGIYKGYVYNSIDEELEIPEDFELLKTDKIRKIVSLSIDTVQQGERLDIEVTTENLGFQQGTNLVHFRNSETGEIISPDNYYISAENKLTISVFFQAGITNAGFYDLLIYKYDFNSNVTDDVNFSNALYVLPFVSNASIQEMPIIQLKQGESVNLIIKGNNTHFTKDINNNAFYLKNDLGRLYPSNVTYVSDDTITCTFKASYFNKIGIYSFYIYTDMDGAISTQNTLEVLKGEDFPRIVSVSVDTVYKNETKEIEITSENIDFTKGENIVRLSRNRISHTAENFSVNTNNSLTIIQTFDANFAGGSYDISIENSALDTTIVLSRAFFLVSDFTLGNENKVLNTEISFYPNPAKDNIYFNKIVDKVLVFDIAGNEVLQEQNVETLSITILQKGVYVLKINLGETVLSKKLIVD